MRRKQLGFTLVEIAIVLVIIGLLLGGILKGQELINSARVRNLVGTLVEVARHRLPPERIAAILESGDRRLAGPTAPARGLWLWEVVYPERDRIG